VQSGITPSFVGYRSPYALGGPVSSFFIGIVRRHCFSGPVAHFAHLDKKTNHAGQRLTDA